MGFTVDKIGVEIVARMERLEADMRRAQAIVDRGAANMDDAISDVGTGRRGKKKGGGMFGGLQRGSKLIRGTLAGFGALQAGVGLAGLANVGTDFVNASRAKTFDESAKAFERLAQSVQGLPFGLGALATALDSLIDKWGRNFNERIAAADIALGAAGSMTDVNEQATEKKRKLDQQIELTNAKDEKDRAAIARRQAIDDANEEARRNAAGKMSPKLIPELQQREIDLAEAEFAKRIRDMKPKVPAFTTFGTVLGSFKAKNILGEGPTQKQAEQAAKDTARNTKGIDKKLGTLIDRGIALVAFA